MLTNEANKSPYPYQFFLESDLLRGRGEKFSGDADFYASWKAKIQESILKAGSTPVVAMEILLANTTSSPHETVKQMLRSQLSSDVQLSRLWSLLDTRYGSQLVLSKGLVERLRKFHRIVCPTNTEKMYELLVFCFSIVDLDGGSSGANYLASPEG